MINLKSYEEYKNSWKGKYKPAETNTAQLSEKHYNNIIQLFKQNNIDFSLIDYIGDHEVYTKNEVNTRIYKSVEEYKKIAIENKKIAIENTKKREASQQEYIEQSQLKEKLKQEIMKNEGITETQYKKEDEARLYREKKKLELAQISQEIKGRYDGYYEGKKSIKAIRAELEGKFSLNVASKMLGINKKSIQQNITSCEWHHSCGGMYDEVDYYDISKYIELAENGIGLYIDDVEYHEEIEKWLKMRQSTKTIDNFKKQYLNII